jgi:hypothetical protein
MWGAGAPLILLSGASVTIFSLPPPPGTNEGCDQLFPNDTAELERLRGSDSAGVFPQKRPSQRIRRCVSQPTGQRRPQASERSLAARGTKLADQGADPGTDWRGRVTFQSISSHFETGRWRLVADFSGVRSRFRLLWRGFPDSAKWAGRRPARREEPQGRALGLFALAVSGGSLPTLTAASGE